MHVLMVNYEWPDVTANCGGGGRIGKRLADALRDRGHEVTVVTDERDGHYTTFPFRTYWRLKRVIESESPDVIHGQFAVPSSLLLPRLATSYDLPLVVTVMGADIHDPTRYHRFRPVIDRASGRVLRDCDEVVAPSRDLQHRTQAKHNVNARVIHYGIDDSRWSWRPRSRTDALEVVTVCRLVERKNLVGALGAISEARAHGVDIRWTLVGTGPMELRLREHWSDVEWLSMPGYVDDLQETYDNADVFLLPSHHEGFGIVYLEALASGLPVVASDNGGQTDIVSDAVGATAPPDSSSDLATALLTVAENYEEYQQATRGYVADNFSIDGMASEYEAAYNSITP